MGSTLQPNEDAIKLRLENLLRDGLEPRIPPVRFRFVSVGASRAVLIVRVPRSWAAPHRVKLGSHAHFYGRNSAGAYQLDVGELRTAFTFSETVTERIRAFRADRLIRIGAEQSPVPMIKAGTMVFHIVPLSTFSSPTPVRLDFDLKERHAFELLGNTGACQQVNLDGYVLFANRDPQNNCYVQIFRSGAVEIVSAFQPITQAPGNDTLILPSGWIERELIQALSHAAKSLADKDVQPPFVVSLSFLGIRNYRLATRDQWQQLSDMAMGQDDLLLAEIVIEQAGFDSAAALRPIFDMLWNAFGYERCNGYDEQGKWINN